MELYQGLLLADANLKAYWRMEAGALTTDSSGQSKTLTNVNSVAESVGGKFGGCADLGSANSNKCLYIADNLGLTRHAQSISFWVKLNAEIESSEWHMFSANNTTYKDGLFMQYQYNSGTRRIKVGYGRNGISNSGEYNHNIVLGTNWHHIVATWTGDAASNGIKLYINNVNVGNATATLGQGSDNNNNVSLGVNHNLNYGFNSCLFDDVAIFDKVLNTTEIGLLYNRIIKTLNGLATASNKTINGLAIASVKSINGLY